MLQTGEHPLRFAISILSYHNAFALSRNEQIDSPPASQRIGCEFSGFIVTQRVKQDFSEPSGVLSVNAECLAKHPCLVPAAWMYRVEAIVLDLTEIENRTVEIRQTGHPRPIRFAS
jgi:hypothetical protein